jgi:L-seryl-tRNA(Ser) seleniumtransferase
MKKSNKLAVAPDNSKLRALPSVDSLLRSEAAKALVPMIGAQRVADIARSVTDEIRAEIQTKGNGANLSREELLAEAACRLSEVHDREAAHRLRRVINATGVILHTNLGRAPLSEAARRAIADEAGRYCTLELDVSTGKRGMRGALVEQLLAELTGAESALVVNNCAAAALLVLSVLARDGETIVSRGELVEIGGDFRVPDVMAGSGTTLIEVGTTNRTRISDYAKALNERTRLVMRVHTSNYRIVGFTRTPNLGELADLAHKAKIPLYEDAGSGALVDFSEYGLTGEPLIAESIAAGADVVSFSGDKLLGGPQAGLIVGRKEIVTRLKTNPLYRALRADKLSLAALQVTLEAHRRGKSFAEVPAQKMIAMNADEIKARSIAFIEQTRNDATSSDLRLEIIDGESAIGGGSGPAFHPATVLISLSHPALTAEQIESSLRHFSPPVIARIVDDRVLLDLRTVAEDEQSELAAALANF